jgi:hypothetical protein
MCNCDTGLRLRVERPLAAGTVMPGTRAEYVEIELEVPNGEHLEVKLYAGTQRIAFRNADSPGLECTGRGFNSSVGSFEVAAFSVRELEPPATIADTTTRAAKAKTEAQPRFVEIDLCIPSFEVGESEDEPSKRIKGKLSFHGSAIRVVSRVAGMLAF